MAPSSLRNTLGDLVAFKTVTGDYQAAVSALTYVKQRLPQLHSQELVDHDYPSLLLTTQPTSHPKLTLLAHIDVVPADSGQFRLISDGDKLYGRGVFDMKFALACYLQLVDELGSQIRHHDFGILITSDEESGGHYGVKRWLDDGYQTNVCLVPDGGDNWQIEQQAKGIWVFKLTLNGTSAHSSRPWRGDNAADKLINCLHELQQLNTNQPDDTTVSINVLRSGQASNQIPDVAQATIDIRYMDLAAYETIHRQVQLIVKRYRAQTETVLFADSAHTDLTNPFVSKFTQIASTITKQTIKPSLSYGGTDGRYFIKQGTPAIVMRPIGGDAHGPNEWISQKSLDDYYQLVKKFVEEYKV